MIYLDNFFRDYSIPAIEKRAFLDFLNYRPSTKYNMNNLRCGKGGIPIHILFYEAEEPLFLSIEQRRVIPILCKDTPIMNKWNMYYAFLENEISGRWAIKRNCMNILKDFKRGTWL